MLNRKRKPKVILIISYRKFDWLYLLIIPELRKRFSTKFILLGSEKSNKYFSKVLTRNDQFIIINEELERSFSNGFGLSDVKEEMKAREIESYYSLNYMCDIIQQDRSLSSSFLMHSPNYIWTQSKVITNANLIRMVNGYVKFAENILNNYKIDIACVWPIDLLGATFSNILENRGVMIAYPYSSKYKSYVFWADTTFQDSKQLEKSFKKVKAFKKIDLKTIRPPDSRYPDTRKMDKTHSTTSLLKRVVKLTFLRIEFFILDLVQLNFPKKRLSFFSILRFQIHKWNMYKFISKHSERDVNKFKKPFLFYAMPLEPEFSVQAKSKEFNDQKAIIKLLALNIPAGYEVIIKEHSDIGRKNKNFYLELLKFPNIRMAHPSIRGVDLVKKARAVASMAGTISLEASIMGKRVVEFSLHSSFSFLDNVFTIKDIGKIKSILGKAMQELNSKTKLEIKKDGAKLIQAIKNISFEAKNTPFHYKNKENISKKDLECVISLLLKNFINHLEK